MPHPVPALAQGRVSFERVATALEATPGRPDAAVRSRRGESTLLRVVVRDGALEEAYRVLHDVVARRRDAVALVATADVLPAVLHCSPNLSVYLEVPFAVLAHEDAADPVLRAVSRWRRPTALRGLGLTMPSALDDRADRQWLMSISRADLRVPVHYVCWSGVHDAARLASFAAASEAMLLHGVSPDELPFDRAGRLGGAREIRSVVTRPILGVAPYDLTTAPLRWLERTPGIGVQAAARVQSHRDAGRSLTDDLLRAAGVDLERAHPWLERPDHAHRLPAGLGGGR
ncbi:MAG: hypothetical protein H3C62_05190 [Gemmatimonadaceae bacterium]|nr:hypothetical protein [Gemmatimonadaceae bacterium]